MTSRRIIWINFSYLRWHSCNEKRFSSMIPNYFNSRARDCTSLLQGLVWMRRSWSMRKTFEKTSMTRGISLDQTITNWHFRAQVIFQRSKQLTVSLTDESYQILERNAFLFSSSLFLLSFLFFFKLCRNMYKIQEEEDINGEIDIDGHIRRNLHGPNCRHESQHPPKYTK